MKVVVTTGAISRAKLQSNHHHQQTNVQFFTGRMPFPTNSVKALKGKIIRFHRFAYPKLTWDLPTLSLTTNSSWLPWGRVVTCLSLALWCQYPNPPFNYGHILTLTLALGLTINSNLTIMIHGEALNYGGPQLWRTVTWTHSDCRVSSGPWCLSLK